MKAMLQITGDWIALYAARKEGGGTNRFCLKKISKVVNVIQSHTCKEVIRASLLFEKCRYSDVHAHSASKIYRHVGQPSLSKGQSTKIRPFLLHGSRQP